MTKIKICGLTRACDIEAVNLFQPEYIGFVFAPKSRRHLVPETAARLKGLLSSDTKAVGVFVNEKPEHVAALLDNKTIDIAQLHGSENEDYIRQLRTLTDKPIIKAFRMEQEQDIEAANNSSAEYILLDSGAGSGKVFDWMLLNRITRPYFLAGGLNPENVEKAVKMWKPYGVDVSSGIETDGYKEKTKMAAFVAAVRKEVSK